MNDFVGAVHIEFPTNFATGKKKFVTIKPKNY